MYSNEQNISSVNGLLRSYSPCNRMIALSDYSSELKGTLDELDSYQPIIMDLNVLQRYPDELIVAKFRYGLDISLAIKFEDRFLVVISFFLFLPTRLEFVGFLWEMIPPLIFLVLRTISWRLWQRWRTWTQLWPQFWGGHRRKDKGQRHYAHCGRNNHASNRCRDKFDNPCWDKFDNPEWA